MVVTEQRVREELKIWSSLFGEEWTDQTTINRTDRFVSFYRLLGWLDIENILEVGCGKGDNLLTLSPLGHYKLVGLDALRYACLKARKYGLEVVVGDCLNMPFCDSSFDLVFTCGVLMHIPPEDMPQAADELWRVSKKYILVIEYYSQNEQAIPWRGYERLLWKRDYGKIFPNLIRTGFLGKDDGFDDCTWWLWRK